MSVQLLDVTFVRLVIHTIDSLRLNAADRPDPKFRSYGVFALKESI